MEYSIENWNNLVKGLNSRLKAVPARTIINFCQLLRERDLTLLCTVPDLIHSQRIIEGLLDCNG